MVAKFEINYYLEGKKLIFIFKIFVIRKSREATFSTNRGLVSSTQNQSINSSLPLFRISIAIEKFSL